MDPLAPLITALHSQGRLRVWSLVITAFGDLVQHRGGEISSTRLRMVLGRVGVEQGALRTALSRLSSDGWVHSERVGRSSQYRLTAQGLDRFASATARIYAPARNEPVLQWAVCVTLAGAGGETTRIVPADQVADGADCVVLGPLQHVSDAYRAAQLVPAHRAALTALAADLGALRVGIDDPLDATAARLLLIHRWRRIVLRFPECVPDLLPHDAPLANPRAAVARAYAALTPAVEGWLTSDAGGLAPLPKASQPAAKRFGGALWA
ncbi:PaaX family transcriptional regulator C-terminal domain-containing protein [Microbulbifer sp. S227A]|uniref:PaaX family transcriptional regulator C-terminal domain-containing protein n=1 Tax=Microbulbifer sp. S227A TaxID=3415131 RepID=UPI003C7EC507